MSDVTESERTREKLAYWELWQGIGAVTEISLIGWIVSGTDQASSPRASAAVAVSIVLAFCIFAMHRRIERLIEQTGRLKRWKSSARS
jgi:hypothetical protein